MRLVFAGHTLDTARHALLRDGTEVHVEPQVFDLLKLLAIAAPELVSRDRIVEEVWGGRIVSESTIAARVAAARAAVGDNGRRQAVIRTIARRGLRLVAAVRREGDDGNAFAAGPVQPRQAGAGSRVRFAGSDDGTRIAWAASGSGPPLLRAGHWLSHLELDWQSPVWRPLLEALGRAHRLVRYDQRGTGLSDRGARNFGLDDLVSDLSAVADAASPDQPLMVFAASQSVPVAIRFAAANPDRVARLVLYGGFAAGSHAIGEPRAMARTEALLEMVRAGWGQPESAFMRATATLFAPGATPEQLDSLLHMQRATADAETATALRRAMARFDVRADLAQLAVPVLVIHARHDAVQPFAQAVDLARGIPGAAMVMLDSANHIPLPQDPAWRVLVAETLGFVGDGEG